MTRTHLTSFIVLGVLVALCAAIVYYDAPRGVGEHTASAAATSIPKTPPRTPPEGFREYRSERYGFALFYPEEMGVTEQDEGQGAMTITFEDASARHGFQIFVVPYNKSSISDARFMQDVPSGVRENLTEMQVYGVTATAFNSVDSFVGETREIWFIANTHLYEMTTTRDAAADLDEIVRTLKFTD